MYQVRSAGSSVRLYTNGVFHSQYNPGNSFSGALWDCLSLPALMLGNALVPATSPRILVLGVGGGAVIRQMNVLFDSPHITGIDVDATHLAVARRWFGVNPRCVQLVHADARCWLGDYRGEGYDIIVDDLFGESEGEPVRAIPLDSKWAGLLLGRLKSGGMIIANCINWQELRAAKLVCHEAFKCQFRLEHALYENSIGVFLTSDGGIRQWRLNMNHHPALDASQRRNAHTLCMRRIVC